MVAPATAVSLLRLLAQLPATSLLPPVSFFHNGVLRSSQHSFVKGRSCPKNLVSFYDQVTNQLGKRHEVDIIYLDFSKAFDAVSHEGLSIKLEDIGLDQPTVRWVGIWLRG